MKLKVANYKPSSRCLMLFTEVPDASLSVLILMENWFPNFTPQLARDVPMALNYTNCPSNQNTRTRPLDQSEASIYPRKIPHFTLANIATVEYYHTISWEITEVLNKEFKILARDFIFCQAQSKPQLNWAEWLYFQPTQLSSPAPTPTQQGKFMSQL